MSHQQACQWTPASAEEVFRVKLFSDTRSGEACYNVCQPWHTQFIWKFLWKEYIGNFLFTHEAWHYRNLWVNILSYYASTALEAENVLVTKMNGKKMYCRWICSKVHLLVTLVWQSCDQSFFSFTTNFLWYYMKLG